MLPGFLIGFPGHGAGVQDDYSGILQNTGLRKSAGFKNRSNRGCLIRIYLATKAMQKIQFIHKSVFPFFYKD